VKYLFTRPAPGDGRFMLLMRDWDNQMPLEMIGVQHDPFSPEELALEWQRQAQEAAAARRQVRATLAIV
jgi:hypothetical protein